MLKFIVKRDICFRLSVVSLHERLRCRGIFDKYTIFVKYYTITAESDGERILKIDQHLAMLWGVRPV